LIRLDDGDEIAAITKLNELEQAEQEIPETDVIEANPEVLPPIEENDTDSSTDVNPEGDNASQTTEE
jgi:hypothetical protein